MKNTELLLRIGTIKRERVGSLMADRDSFVFLYDLVAQGPTKLTAICARYKVSPSTVADIVQQLVRLGFVTRRAGSYAATSLGRDVIEFVKEAVKDVQFPEAKTEALVTTEWTCLDGSVTVVPTTNNGTYADLPASGYATGLNGDAEPVITTRTQRAQKLTTDDVIAGNETHHINYL